MPNISRPTVAIGICILGVLISWVGFMRLFSIRSSQSLELQISQISNTDILPVGHLTSQPLMIARAGRNGNELVISNSSLTSTTFGIEIIPQSAAYAPIVMLYFPSSKPPVFRTTAHGSFHCLIVTLPTNSFVQIPMIADVTRQPSGGGIYNFAYNITVWKGGSLHCDDVTGRLNGYTDPAYVKDKLHIVIGQSHL